MVETDLSSTSPGAPSRRASTETSGREDEFESTVLIVEIEARGLLSPPLRPEMLDRELLLEYSESRDRLSREGRPP